MDTWRNFSVSSSLAESSVCSYYGVGVHLIWVAYSRIVSGSLRLSLGLRLGLLLSGTVSAESESSESSETQGHHNSYDKIWLGM